MGRRKNFFNASAFEWICRGLCVLALGLITGSLDARASCSPDCHAPDATVYFSGGSADATGDYTWASGTLRYEGASYPLRVDGLAIVDIGTPIKASGAVYGLATLQDLKGTYAEVEADGALAGEGYDSVLENEHGVLIGLSSTTQGLQFSPSLLGVSIDLE